MSPSFTPIHSNPLLPYGGLAPSDANALPTPSHHNGHAMPTGPEALQGNRPPSTGGMAPQQKLSFNAGPTANGPAPDAATKDAIAAQDQQSANAAALAMSTARASGQQALNDFLKSMAEMEAKTIKDAGSKMAGLA